MSLTPLFVPDDPVGNVVFVHGLEGDADSTWGSNKASSWQHWLSTRCPKVASYGLSYPNAAFFWRGHSMALHDRAVNVLATLQASGVFDKPFVLVTHSMGGLLAKQMLRVASQKGQFFEAMANCCGIVFLATPHGGSPVASLATFLGQYLGVSAPLRDLESFAAHLRDLNQWFRGFASEARLPVLVCYETKRTFGVIVVDAGSSDPGLPGVVPIPIDANHIEISKPESESALVASLVLGFVESHLSSSKGSGAASDNRSRDVPHGTNIVSNVTANTVNIRQIYAPDESDE
jgi:pimeloyl-ACP methyl ester carboxylesterase